MVSDVLKNIRLIREKEEMSQDAVAEKMNITQSAYARFERGATKTDLATLYSFSNVMGMSVFDVIAYPKKMIIEDEDVSIEAILQLKLTKAKKDEVLKMVFGDNNFEILKT